MNKRIVLLLFVSILSIMIIALSGCTENNVGEAIKTTDLSADKIAADKQLPVEGGLMPVESSQNCVQVTDGMVFDDSYNGQTIVPCPGVYNFPNGITIRGADHVTFDCQGQVKFVGGMLEGEAGIFIDEIPYTSKNNVIKNCEIENYDFGIRVRGSSHSLVNNKIMNVNNGVVSHIGDAYVLGYYYLDASLAYDTMNDTFINNTIINATMYGINMGISVAIMRDNYVSTYGDGYRFRMPGRREEGLPHENLEIEDFKNNVAVSLLEPGMDPPGDVAETFGFFVQGLYGILGGLPEESYYYPDIKNNTAVGFDRGLLLTGFDGVTVLENMVIGNDIGVWAYGDINFYDNTVKDNNVGLYVQKWSVGGMSLVGNDVQGNGVGIQFTADEGVEVSNNRFCGNDEVDVNVTCDGFSGDVFDGDQCDILASDGCGFDSCPQECCISNVSTSSGVIPFVFDHSYDGKNIELCIGDYNSLMGIFIVADNMVLSCSEDTRFVEHWSGNSMISILGSNNSVTGCSFVHTTIGILVNGSYNRVFGNTFEMGGTDILINGEANIIEDNHMQGSYVSGITISNLGDSNIIRGNTVSSSYAEGLVIEGTGTWVQNNRVEFAGLNYSSEGIYLSPEAKDTVLVNNQLVGNYEGLFINGASGTALANNVMCFNVDADLICADSSLVFSSDGDVCTSVGSLSGESCSIGSCDYTCPDCSDQSTYFCGDINNRYPAADIVDLVYLVTWMFSGGPEPMALCSANVNGDSTVDIADLVYLVDYMFSQGPALNCAPVTRTSDDPTGGQTYDQIKQTISEASGGAVALP